MGHEFAGQIFELGATGGPPGGEGFDIWYKMIAMLENGLDARRMITQWMHRVSSRTALRQCCR